MEKTIDLYSAIAEIRRLTKLDKSFSFSFMSYYRDRQTSQGVVHVLRAKLRAATHTRKITPMLISCSTTLSLIQTTPGNVTSLP